jgi:hypothetical protein
VGPYNIGGLIRSERDPSLHPLASVTRKGQVSTQQKLAVFKSERKLLPETDYGWYLDLRFLASTIIRK